MTGDSAPNGLGYPLVGGTRLAAETEKTQSRENAQKTRRVPTCPLHAVLGGTKNQRARLLESGGKHSQNSVGVNNSRSLGFHTRHIPQDDGPVI